MSTIDPSISLIREANGYRVEQHRPPAGDVLGRLKIDAALGKINALLPICGEAQRIAASRAIAAARGETESREMTERHEQQLLHEQVQSSIWRLTVDWPSLLGEERDLATLRFAMRTTDTPTLQALLADKLDGLANVNDSAELPVWIERRGCTASRLIARAADLDRALEKEPLLTAPIPVRTPGDVLAACLGYGFWPEADAALAPPPGEVGAIAMARHPLTASLAGPFGRLTRRLLAQALDAAFLVGADAVSAGLGQGVNSRRLAGQSGDSTAERAQDDGAVTGIGWAMTARGPLVHRVVLGQADADRALRWDVLAPTDWHFAVGGPVHAMLAESGAPPDAVRWLSLIHI